MRHDRRQIQIQIQNILVTQARALVASMASVASVRLVPVGGPRSGNLKAMSWTGDELTGGILLVSFVVVRRDLRRSSKLELWRGVERECMVTLM